MTAKALARAIWHSPYLLLTLPPFFWGGNFVVGRAVHGLISPISLAFWRWVIALVPVLILAAPHLKRDWPALWAGRWQVLFLGALGIGAYNTLIYIGLGQTTAVNALLLQSVMPVLILLVSFLLHGERSRPVQFLGVAVSLAGVAVIAGRGSWQALGALHVNGGDLWVMVAIVGYAFYSVGLRRRPQVQPASFLAATFIVGVVLLLPFFLFEVATTGFVMPGGVALLAIGYVALFPSFLAYLCFNRGVELIGANRAGQFIHLLPMFGSLMAVLFLGEDFQMFHVYGIGLIAAGIVLVSVLSGRAGRSGPLPAADQGSRGRG